MPGEEINTTLRFDADITDVKAAMQEATRATKLANSEFKSVAAGMDDWSNSTDGLSAKLRQLSTVQQAEERKLAVLKTAYQTVVKEQGENSAAAVDLATKINNQQAVVSKTAKEYDSYSAKLEEVEKAADGAADDIKKAGDAAKDAGEAAEESGEGWTIVKDVIADMVSNTINWAIDSFKELMTASSSSLSMLGAQTGATTEQLKAYDGVMKDIYRNNYGESFDDVSDAMSKAIQTFGHLDNASLQNITQKAITLRDAFGMDYQESMRAVNSLMDQFGITADEAFNLIVQGAQQGLNQNDDLLDTVNEYSVQFRQAGYSADDMFNMLKNGASEGTWSVDKLGDAVKEFNIRAKDGTVGEALFDYMDALGLTIEEVAELRTATMEGGEKGAEAYGKIVEAMNKIENPEVKYRFGVEAFGTMWEDLGETTVQSLMRIEGGISSAADAMTELQNVRYDNLNDALGALGRIIQSDLIQPIVDTLEPIARNLVNWLIDNMGTLQPIIVGVASAVGVLAAALAIQGVINGVSKAFSLLTATMKANTFVLVASLIAGLVTWFITAYKTNDEFRQKVDKAWAAIKSGIGSAIDWIGKKIDSLVKWWKELPGKISSAISGAVGKVTTWGRNLYNAAKTKVTETVSGVTSWFKELPGKIASAISGAVDRVVSWGKSMASKGKQAASDLVSAVVDKVKSLPGDMLSIGSDIAAGVWDGISGSLSWIKGKISGWVGDVTSFIKRLFGINSPSRLMRDEVGMMLGLGVGEGVEDSIGNVRKSLNKLATSAVDTIGGSALGGPSPKGVAAGGKTIIFNQTNNSPRALSQREIFRQTHNALAFVGGN